MTAKNERQAESKSTEEGAPDICPYWHQVTSDFASMYPAGGYCIAGCHKKIKVMAAKTLDEVCAMKYGECEGYQRVLAEEDERQRKAPESLRR